MRRRTEIEIMKNWKEDIKTPVLSICCPTYNHEHYIAQAIDSFLMQETTFPFEIIIRDDCSQDNTAKILEKYTNEYPNLIIPIFEKENTYSKGVKPGLEVRKKAVGKYIALCEGDDYWTDPLKLQKQVNFLEMNDEYVLTYHKTRKVNEKDEILTDKVDAVDYDADEKALKCTKVYIQTCTVVFRHIPLEYTDELKNAYNGDAVLWHLLAFHGKSKYLQNIDYAHYRVHQGGIWSGLNLFGQFLNSTNTRLAILDNLKEDKVLYACVQNMILEKFSIKFYESIKNLNTKQLIQLFTLMNSTKHIKTHKFIKSILKKFIKNF